MHVGAGLDELGREPERLRGRVRVLEAARVGDEADVERLGDLAASAATPSSASRSRTISAVDEASATIRLACRSACCRGGGRRRPRAARARGAPGPADAALVRAVDGDERRARRCRPAARGSTSSSGMKPELGRAAAPSPARYMSASLPSARSPSVHREHRAERVAVGVFVRRRRGSGRASGARARTASRSVCAVSFVDVSSVAPPATLVDQLRHADAALDGADRIRMRGAESCFSRSSRATRACR